VEDAMDIAIEMIEIRRFYWFAQPGESGFDDIRKCYEFIELTLDIQRSCRF
jgi:hypothetical protein